MDLYLGLLNLSQGTFLGGPDDLVSVNVFQILLLRASGFQKSQLTTHWG